MMLPVQMKRKVLVNNNKLLEKYRHKEKVEK